jgi:hypothetical protein
MIEARQASKIDRSGCIHLRLAGCLIDVAQNTEARLASFILRASQAELVATFSDRPHPMPERSFDPLARVREYRSQKAPAPNSCERT